MENLGSRVKATRISPSVAAGQTLVTAQSIDMQGYAGALLEIVLGSIAPGGTVLVSIRSSSDDGVGDTFVQMGLTEVIPEAAADGVVLIDVVRPRERFIQVAVLRLGADSEVDSITALQYGAVQEPPAHDASVAETLLLVGQ